MTPMKQALLSACAASAIVFSISAASAQTTLCGGGSSLAGAAYINIGQLLTLIDPSTVLSYTVSSSGQGQAAFFSNTPGNSLPVVETCSAPVAYGASDAFLSAGQIANWNSTTTALGSITYTTAGNVLTQTYTYVGITQSGNLLQIPMFGTPITVPFFVPGDVSGDVTLTDAQLCGIFSGLYSDWSQVGATVAAGKTAPTGPIYAVYRSDGSGTSFLFTNHLRTVCPNSGLNLASTNLRGGAFSATQNFSTLFTSVPATLHGASGSGGVQGAITGNPQSVGYVSPDFTAIAPINTGNSAVPAVMRVVNGTNNVAYLPNVPSTSTALNTPGQSNGGSNPQDAFAPVYPNPSAGYPIVGYTYWDVAQCFSPANASVGTSLRSYISNLYGQPVLAGQLGKSGFVPASGSLQNTVRTQLLDPTQPNGIGNATVCANIGR